MNAQDLLPALGVGQVDFNVDFEPSWPQHCLVEQILAVGHADDHDVVQRFHSVDVGQQLIDHLIANLRANTALHPSLLANRIYLIEDYDVKRALISQFLLVGPCLSEELPDVFLGLTHKLAEYFRAVDDLEILDVQSLSKLPGDECFSCSWRSKQENTFDMLNAKALDR